METVSFQLSESDSAESLTSLLGCSDHPWNCGIGISPHEAPNKTVDPIACYDQISLLGTSICEDHFHPIVGFNDVHNASADSHLGFIGQLLVQDLQETPAF